jgi:hypothetical protein
MLLSEVERRDCSSYEQKSSHLTAKITKEHTATYTATNSFFAEHDRTCLYSLWSSNCPKHQYQPGGSCVSILKMERAMENCQSHEINQPTNHPTP